MSHVLVIAARELRERNRIFVAAAAFAVLPFLTALLPGAKTMGRPMMIALTGGLLAVAMGLGVAVSLGASMVGRELSEKRLSFFFAKPVSSGAIWWGKVVASLVAAVMAFAIILIPSLMLGTEVWKKTWTLQPDQLIPITLVSMVVLFFVAHVASTMIRSRSALLALDLALLFCAAAALYAIAQPLLSAMALRLLAWTGAAVGIALVLVMAVVPMWQLERGRTDRKRSHAALSLYLWSGVAIVVALAAGFVLWVTTVSPADLTKIYLAQGPGSGPVLLAGQAANRMDYNSAFLVRRDGSTHRLAAPWSLTFSGDGNVAAWTRVSGLPWQGRSFELIAMRLDDRNAKPIETNLRTSGSAGFVLSFDGSRIAWVEGSTVSVHDVGSGQLLASARLEAVGRWPEMFFRTNDSVQIVSHRSIETGPGGATRYRLGLFELDIPGRRVLTGPEIEAGRGYSRFSGDGRYLATDAGVYAAATGAAVTKLSPQDSRRTSTVLADGRVIAIAKGGVIGIHSRSGELLRQVVVPGTTWVNVLGEHAPGKLVVGIMRSQWSPQEAASGRHMALAILDADSGSVTNLVEGAGTRGGWWWGLRDPRHIRIDATRIAAIDAAGKPMLVNVLTGEKKALVRE
ncbi:MAG: hypothetical protein WA208_14310 [Thermoanaerobaculia bacterium]